jgi:hypothetical protein
MSADETIRFQFNFRGVEIEISGEDEFVDEMYRELMRDIQAARQCLDEPEEEVAPPDAAPEDLPVWIHRCSEMMRKIYMTNAESMQGSILARVLDFSLLRTLYVDKYVFDSFLPTLAGEHTLWAELTDEGRRTIDKLPSGAHKTPTES